MIRRPGTRPSRHFSEVSEVIMSSHLMRRHHTCILTAAPSQYGGPDQTVFMSPCRPRSRIIRALRCIFLAWIEWTRFDHQSLDDNETVQSSQEYQKNAAPTSKDTLWPCKGRRHESSRYIHTIQRSSCNVVAGEKRPKRCSYFTSKKMKHILPHEEWL